MILIQFRRNHPPQPKVAPFLPVTLYMLVATVAFPQAYKHAGDRLDDLEINFFRLVVLPVLYVVGPVVVLYSFFKKKD